MIGVKCLGLFQRPRRLVSARPRSAQHHPTPQMYFQVIDLKELWKPLFHLIFTISLYGGVDEKALTIVGFLMTHQSHFKNTNFLLHCRFFKRWGLGGLLSWWLSSEESACQCRRRLDPWSGKIPHAAEQLSRSAPTTEPMCCNYDAQPPERVLCSKSSLRKKEPTACSGEHPTLCSQRGAQA